MRCNCAKFRCDILLLASTLNQEEQQEVWRKRPPILFWLKNYTPPLRWYQMEWCILHFLRLHASSTFLKLAQSFMQQSQSPVSFMIQIKTKHGKYITSFQLKEQSIVTPAATKQWNWEGSLGGNMRPGCRKGWEGLPLVAEVYSYWLKAVMKLWSCNKQGFHPGEEKTKTKT